jgi:orotidine-5'-phosphate decarboxylase
VNGFDWFFDGKIYDIPLQAAGAIRAITRLKPTFISLHVGILKPNASEEERRQEDSMLMAARSAAHNEAHRLGVSRPKLLAVTILTHLPATHTQVVAMGHRAMLCGMDGLISSPWELSHLRSELGIQPILMAPGIRDMSVPHDDQYRTTTAWAAMMHGANFIVVGRPITEETVQQKRRDTVKAILDSLP